MVRFDSRIGHLPVELTSFVDRRDEITQLRRLVWASRLVTLIGVGGCGKTRLAVRVATGLRRAFDAGVWHVDLAALRDPALMWHAVAQALEIEDQTDRPMADVVVEYLRERELLLLLDNCEHLLDACAALVATLLPAAPRLRVLCTSRRPLGLSGEQLFQVPPLLAPQPDRPVPSGAALRYPALILFAERGRAADPRFTLTSANLTAVAGICRNLDGLPLAIELAAARLRMLSVDQLATGLRDRFRLLGVRYATPARHATLTAAFDWSFALCSPREQLLWARLSVFASSFDLAAVQAVCSGDDLPADGMLDVVAGLVDQSVLVRDDTTATQARYRLLETIREYGAARLRDLAGAQETQRLRRRHRDHYLALAEQGWVDWCGPDQEQAYIGLRREHANLRAALDYSLTTAGEAELGLHLAGTLWFYWTGCGFLREGRQWLDRALTIVTEPNPARAKALWATGALAIAQGDMDTATNVLHDSWALATQSGDELLLAFTAQTVGTVALLANDYLAAANLLGDALDRFQAIGEVNPGMLMGQSSVAMVAAMSGDLDRAERLCRQALTLCEQRGDRWAAAWQYYVLALIALIRGDIPAGIAHARDGLRHHHLFQNLTGIAMLLELYTQLLVADGAAEPAAVLHGAAEQIWQVLGRRLFGSAALNAQHQQCEAAARRAIGERAYEAAFGRGTRLSLDDTIAYAIADATPPAPPAPPPAGEGLQQPLTPREREVAELLAQGLTNRQIATHLVTAQRTVESHVENILRKLGFTSRTQIAAWTTQHDRPSSSDG